MCDIVVFEPVTVGVTFWSMTYLIQKVSMLHEALSAKLLASATEAETRQRQLDAMRHDDDAKLRAARGENEALRDELEAMVTGSKRTDVGLVGFVSSVSKCMFKF